MMIIQWELKAGLSFNLAGHFNSNTKNSTQSKYIIGGHGKGCKQIKGSFQSSLHTL